MNLFDDDLLDYYKTRIKVKDFMQVTLPKLLRLSNVHYLDDDNFMLLGMSREISKEYYFNEKNITGENEALYALELIITACNNLPVNQRTMIELRYIKMKPWWIIENETSYGKTMATQILNDALIGFAWSFKNVKNLLVFVEKH